MKKSLFPLFIIIIIVALLSGVSVCAAPVVSARCGILVDAATGRVLWEQCADEQSLIASTTKIMTGLLIAESCDLDARVAVADEAIGIEGSSIYLKQGEVLTVRELLYGMMLHSGNDAAAALAIYHAGSTEEFAAQMNRRAEELGLNSTHFSNPHGLDDVGNYSTARDLAVLAGAAMENPVFSQVVSSKTAAVGSRSFTNHNKLLWKYEGTIGVKTGFTKSAGRILVSCAQRDGRRLVAVTINAPNDWQDHCQLLEYGFTGFENRKLFEAGQVLSEVPVLCGAEETGQVVLREAVVYPLRPEETVTFRLDVPVSVFAPVLAGDPAGRLILLVDGREVLETPLFWRYSVLEGG